MIKLLNNTKIFFFLLFFYFTVSAQTPFLRKYSVDDGLPSSHIYRVFQDSEGFIWICTDRGLSRFDGYRFENYGTKNGLPFNDIWNIAEDNFKRLWVATYANHLIYYDLNTHRFVTFETPQMKGNVIQTFLKPTKDSILIVANTIVFSANLVSKKVRRISSKSDSTLRQTLKTEKFTDHLRQKEYAGFENKTMNQNYSFLQKYNVFEENKDIQLNKKESLSAAFINPNSTAIITSTKVYISKRSGIISKNITDFTSQQDSRFVSVEKIGTSENIILYTNHSVILTDSELNHLKTFDFINQFNINSVYFDREGNFWICTKDRGLFLLTKEAQKSFVVAETEKNAIKSLAKDKNNNLWFGTDKGELFVYKDGKIKRADIGVENNSPIRNIVVSKNGSILVNWNNNLSALFDCEIINQKQPSRKKEIEYVVNAARTRNFWMDKSPSNIMLLKGFQVKNGFFDDNDLLYFCTSSSLYTVDCSTNQRYSGTLLDLVLRGLTILKNTKTNEVFLGSSDGIYALDLAQNKAENLSFSEFKKNVTINDIIFDENKAIWIATDGNGVWQYAHKKFKEIKKMRGKIVKSLYFDNEQKRVWAATNEGVFTISKKKNDEIELSKISLAQGLPTLEVHSVLAENDILYAGTNNGLSIFNLQSFFHDKKTQQSLPPIRIKAVSINGKDTTKLENYQLNYTQNTIEIDFVALSFKSDKNIRYEYKLTPDNQKSSWQEVGNTKVSFTFLPPGNYKFELRAFDIEERETTLTKPIIFVINPPFYRTWWFWMIMVTLGLGMITLITFVYRNQAKKELEISKRFAELELQALQSQMNPHFVFNALSSIQNFILNKETDAANEYLTNFSKLIRLFLESSRSRYIAIADEKILIEKYIQLEQTRFQHKFNFEIKENNFIEPTFEIPSMLIQPFVENAINHGLVYKEGKGKLDVSFEIKNDIFICIVEDDGIGRAKAKELRTKSLKAYKSRATQIIEERLQTLKLVDGTSVKIDITDKINNTGTKVEIKILMK